MTTIRLEGIKRYISKGRFFYYLRKTGKRIIDPITRRPIDPDKEPELFAARVAQMKAEAEAIPQAPKVKAGSLLGLIEEWRGVSGTDGRPRRDPSPEWQSLAPATRKSYDRFIDPETGYLRRVLKSPLDQVSLLTLDTPNVVKIRNRTAKRFGYWNGNYAVTVLSSMLKFGLLYGHVKANTAKGVPALDRPEGLAVKHRRWADSEFWAMLAEARKRKLPGLILALGLGRFAGWATGDICHQPPSTWQRPRLVYVRRKTRKRGRVTSVTAPEPLLALLDEFPPDPAARTLVTNRRGNPYTEDTLKMMVRRLANDLAKDGKVKPGLNIHGLRHSLGSELYDLDVEKEARKRMLAHESDRSAAVYERGGDGGRHADKAVRALNRKHRGT